MSVGGRVYGPYSLEQMRSFHAENRLGVNSMVAREGEEQFRSACEDPALAPLFGQEPVAVEEPVEPAQPCCFGAQQDVELSDGQPAHFVIVADMKSRSISGLEQEISNLGEAQRFGPQAWVLLSEGSISTIRNALSQKLGKLDELFVVDASHDKAAWFNFGPETNSRLRKLWSHATDYSGTERRAFRRA